jgi:hypothetical protein
MPSRQERRKTGAAGAAAAARANANPLGGWTTQADDPEVLLLALGPETVRLKAAQGDREAQFSWGFDLLCDAPGAVGEPLGAGGSSPKADVGLALCTALLSGISPV